MAGTSKERCNSTWLIKQPIHSRFDWKRALDSQLEIYAGTTNVFLFMVTVDILKMRQGEPLAMKPSNTL